MRRSSLDAECRGLRPDCAVSGLTGVGKEMDDAQVAKMADPSSFSSWRESIDIWSGSRRSLQYSKAIEYLLEHDCGEFHQ